MSGCRSFFVACGVMFAGMVLGSLAGLPSGMLGVIGGAFILPWALVMGTIGWGMISFPWLVLRFFAKALPELSTARAIAGFVLVSPPMAAGAGWYLAAEANAPTWALVVEPLLYGALAVPLALVVATFGRDGMMLFLAGAAGAAEGA